MPLHAVVQWLRASSGNGGPAIAPDPAGLIMLAAGPESAAAAPSSLRPRRTKCSGGTRGPRKGEPACAAEGSVYGPPAALIAALLESAAKEKNGISDRCRLRDG